MKAIEIEGIDPEVVKKLDAIELGKARHTFCFMTLMKSLWM